MLIPYQSRDRRVDFCDGFAFVCVSFFSFSFFFRTLLAFSFYCKTGATFKITRVNSFLVVCAVLSHPFRTPSPHRHCVSLLRNALPTLTHSSHSLSLSLSLAPFPFDPFTLLRGCAGTGLRKTFSSCWQYSFYSRNPPTSLFPSCNPLQ